MTDITPQQVGELGTDAMALMFNLIRRNEDERQAILAGLHDSVQRDLEEANATINRIRGNVLTVLRRPHTDAMIAYALQSDKAKKADLTSRLNDLLATVHGSSAGRGPAHSHERLLVRPAAAQLPCVVHSLRPGLNLVLP